MNMRNEVLVMLFGAPSHNMVVTIASPMRMYVHMARVSCWRASLVDIIPDYIAF